jgi:thiol-disulfide isomerase/thioredoxin
MKRLHMLAAAAAFAWGSAWAGHGVQPFEPQSLEQVVAEHQGRPFLLVVWSMDCEFCQASLDTLARVRARHPGLRVVTVSTDPIGNTALQAQLAHRLGSLSLLDQAWSFGSKSPEQLRFAIDPRWHGEKPRSYWYDAQGKRASYSGLITAERVEDWLQQQTDREGQPK